MSIVTKVFVLLLAAVIVGTLVAAASTPRDAAPPSISCVIAHKRFSGGLLGPNQRMTPFVLVTFHRAVGDSIIIPDDPVDALMCSRVPAHLDTLQSQTR